MGSLVRRLAIALVMGASVMMPASPAQAHASLCIKSNPPVVETFSATRLRADAAIGCPPGGHETWVSAQVVLQQDFGTWWNRDWGQAGAPSRTDRAPDVGYSPGTAKRAGAVKIVSCQPGTYRARVTYEVGGPAGTITTRMTSANRKVDCRT